MDMLLLIKTIATLTGVLGVLIFFYFYFTYKNPSKQKKISQKPLHAREVQHHSQKPTQFPYESMKNWRFG